MDFLEFLFAGFAVFWAALFVYLLMLQNRLRQVTKQLEQLEERLAESEAPAREAAVRGRAGAPSRSEPAGPADATSPQRAH